MFIAELKSFIMTMYHPMWLRKNTNVILLILTLKWRHITIYHNSEVRLFLGRTIHTFDIYDICAYLDILKSYNIIISI